MLAGNPLRCSAVSLRVAAHSDVGGFDPRYRYVVDWDFWVRVARRWSLTWLAATTVDVRWHLASETQRFRTGVADLEETEEVSNAILSFAQERERDQIKSVRSLLRQRLARAYLNRAHVALKAGDGGLAKLCLHRSFRTWPGIVRVIASDVRLAFQMSALCAAPGLTARWLARGGTDYMRI
ncbi:MAG: hypothetical protein NVSMB9_21050 [Isosphaeraceae bacterium]